MRTFEHIVIVLTFKLPIFLVFVAWDVFKAIFDLPHSLRPKRKQTSPTIVRVPVWAADLRHSTPPSGGQQQRGTRNANQHRIRR